ncbi:hypothetical protein Y1Q_0016555 [Alligator mississippiensis]|uniref:Uncharacterized protein n=1 Tax=Alligator mississippiensis TaxID=8496 RepID=A0A151N339_ALLMI|nr:hypothetical protein Y1Q_0016555 [Alligator mississippiensis]
MSTITAQAQYKVLDKQGQVLLLSKEQVDSIIPVRPNQISVTVDWETIMKIPTGDSSPLSEVKATAVGIK